MHLGHLLLRVLVVGVVDRGGVGCRFCVVVGRLVFGRECSVVVAVARSGVGQGSCEPSVFPVVCHCQDAVVWSVMKVMFSLRFGFSLSLW